MFDYYFAPRAVKEVKRLPKRFQRQGFDAIEDVCKLSHPLKSLRVLKLEGFAVPTYRLRSGDYRIIFRVSEKKLLVGEIRNRQKGY